MSEPVDLANLRVGDMVQYDGFEDGFLYGFVRKIYDFTDHEHPKMNLIVVAFPWEVHGLLKKAPPGMRFIGSDQIKAVLR